MSELFDKIKRNVELINHILIPIIMIVLVAPLAYMLWDREPPVTILSQTLLTPRVYAGQVVEYQQTIVRKRLCQTTVDRRLIDNDGIVHHFAPIASVSGGSLSTQRHPETRIIRVAIPSDAASGEAMLTATVSYICNPVHYIYPINVELDKYSITILDPFNKELADSLEKPPVQKSLEELLRNNKEIQRTIRSIIQTD